MVAGTKLSISWSNIALVSLFSLTPIPLYFLSVLPFQPRQVVYENDLFPLLLAPLNVSHNSALGWLSRFGQAALVALHGLPTSPYYVWLVIAAGRIALGALLSRGMGWAFPALFSHNALYEAIGGVGPLLAGCAVFRMTSEDWKSTGGLLPIAALLVLDDAPWSYAIGATVTTGWLFVKSCMSPPQDATERYELVSDASTSHTTSPPIARRVVALCSRLLVCLVALVLVTSFARVLAAALTSHNAVLCPNAAESHPLLHILVITAPRTRNTSSDVLSSTIFSYLPLLGPCVSISVYTHFPEHDAMDRAKNLPAFHDVTFHTTITGTGDEGYEDGQHLHVARALQWSRNRDDLAAEWTMLVEDDFPLCGQWGVDGLVQTVDALRRRRKQGGHMSGFVGTGGSGLLLHSSIIPIAANLLLTQAMSTNLLAPTATDIVLQQCIRGVNPLCPPSTLLIPSRLIMHHAGGELSTFEGRSYPQDRWACGWRHPMHGMKDVEVVFDERPY